MKRLSNLLSYSLRHPIGGQSPVRTLGRIAAWQVRSRAFKGPHRVPWVNGSVLLAERGMTGATGNIYFGLHEAADMAFIAHFLRPGEQFVDAGANVGSYTVLAGVVSGADVHAFEPAAETLPRLRANIYANNLNATVHPVALGDRDGTAHFTVGQGSTNALSADGAASVPLRTLDSFGFKPVAMKADLEGGELGMLRGAHQTLSSLLAVELETVTPEAFEIMSAAGFEPCYYDPFTRTIARGQSKSNNSLFVREVAEAQRRVASGPTIRWNGLSV